MRGSRFAALRDSLIALGIALGVSAAIVTLAGASAWQAFAALIEGAFGSVDALSEVGVKTCPLLLTGIAVAIAFRAGLWNIGAEGQLLVGATAMAWIGTRFTMLPAGLALPTALLGAAAAGAAWATLVALLKIHRDVSEVISTIMLNFVALWTASYLVHGPLMQASGAYPQSDALLETFRLSRFAAGYRAHAGLLIGLAVAALSYILLFRTTAGYEMRVVGQNPDAARLAGLSPVRATVLSLALSGAIAGLAGAIEVSAVTYRLYEKFSPGYGFTAIAVALLGRLHPAGVCLAAILFGALEAGSSSMQRVAGVSSVLVSVIQAIVIFSLLAVEHRAHRPAPSPQPPAS